MELCRKTTVYDSRNLKSALATTQYTGKPLSKPATAKRPAYGKMDSMNSSSIKGDESQF